MDSNKEKKTEGLKRENVDINPDFNSAIQQDEFTHGKPRPTAEDYPIQQKKEDEGQSIDTRALRRVLREEVRSTEQGERFFQRGVGKGIGGINRFAANAGRIGTRTAAQGGRVAVQIGARIAAAAPAVVGFFASPPGWIVLGVIALIAVITFLIVRLTGQNVDATQINFQEINTSSIQLSLTPTETPSATPSSTATPPAKP